MTPNGQVRRWRVGVPPALNDVTGSRRNAAPFLSTRTQSEEKGQAFLWKVSGVTGARPVNRTALAQGAKLVAIEDADDRRAVRAHDWLDAAVQCVIAVEGHTRKKMMD